MLDRFPAFPYDSIKSQFDSLLIATGNKLDREWPVRPNDHGGSRSALRALMLISANTFRTIMFFCADSPPNHARRLEYGLSATPLARTILDALSTVVFLYEDLPIRTDWYHKSGWRELHSENARYHAAYGTDAGWKTYLVNHDAFLAKCASEWGLSAAEQADPSSIPWWPTPSQMVSPALVSPDRLLLLRHLNDWFQRELSQDSHLSWPGLARRGAVLSLRDRDGEANETLIKAKSDAVLTALTLLQCLMSEFDIEMKFGLSNRLKYVWGIVNPYFAMSKEVYDLRYATRL